MTATFRIITKKGIAFVSGFTFKFHENGFRREFGFHRNGRVGVVTDLITGRKFCEVTGRYKGLPVALSAESDHELHRLAALSVRETIMRVGLESIRSALDAAPSLPEPEKV